MRGSGRHARWIGFLAVIAFAFATAPPVRAAEPSAPKHIFLFIGDGMGFEQVKLADLASIAREGSSMRMTRLPVTGQIHTHSANRPVTDSAAAATALACGVKTDNGRIGQLPDGTPVEPISLKLLAEGMSIGVLTSVTANHATPAPFYSQAANRNMYEDIGMQFVGSGVHFLAGRGLAGSEQVREALMSAYRENGIEVVTDYADAAGVPKDRRMALLARSVGNPVRQEGDLADATALAVERLKDNPAGFFMIIEGGAIDWVCHANRGWASVEETLAMDRAVEVAYRFYLENPGNTLIVITADHETGGLKVHDEDLDLPELRRIEEERERFGGGLPANAGEITMETLIEAVGERFGITTIPEQQREQIENAIRRGRRADIVRLAVNIPQAKAGIAWSTGGHTGVDVPVYALGAGAERFRGTYDMTLIPAKIFEAATGRPLLAE